MMNILAQQFKSTVEKHDMISKKELRIGNMVYINNHRESFFEILQLRDKVVMVKGERAFQVEYELLVPVPISKQLLEQFDFKGENWQKRRVNDYLTISVRPLNGSGFFKLMLVNEIPNEHITKEESENINLHNLSGKRADDDIIRTNGVQLPPVQYLHQLQNKFFELSGKELL